MYVRHTMHYVLPLQMSPVQPGAQAHEKALMRSVHSPPFMHGALAHSSMLTVEHNQNHC